MKVLGLSTVAAAASFDPGLLAWFNAWDTNDDQTWSQEEVAHMVGVLGAKDEGFTPETARVAEQLMGHAAEFLASLGETGETSALSQQAFLEKVTTGDKHLPNQVRVTPSDGGMAVTWVQENKLGAVPCLQWCDTAHNSCTTIKATTWKYSVPPRWWDPHGNGYATIHGGLVKTTPGTAYSYAVGNSSEACASPDTWYYVKTPPSKDHPTRVAVVGDMGSVQLFGFKIADLMKEEFPSWDPSAVFIMGDVAYAGIATNVKFLNITSDDELEPFWNVYGAMMDPITSTYPTITSHGNHDNFYNSIAYLSRWTSGPAHLTALPPDLTADTWYGIDIGNIHYTVLDSEVAATPGSPQYAFARADLAAASAARSAGTGPAWLVLVNHRPFISSDTSEINSHSPDSTLIQAVQPLCLQYGVDVTLTGHQHAYERIHPQVNGTVVSTPTGAENIYSNIKAPVQVMVGTGGAVQEETWSKPSPTWSAARSANVASAYGYGAMTALNATHLFFEFRSVVVNATHPADHFWILK